jgi:hypothetical protein
VSWFRDSDDRWEMTSGLAAPTIAVIERPAESYDQHHERKKREEGAPRRSFGFGRVLDDVRSRPAASGDEA